MNGHDRRRVSFPLDRCQGSSELISHTFGFTTTNRLNESSSSRKIVNDTERWHKVAVAVAI